MGLPNPVDYERFYCVGAKSAPTTTAETFTSAQAVVVAHEFEANARHPSRAWTFFFARVNVKTSIATCVQ